MNELCSTQGSTSFPPRVKLSRSMSCIINLSYLILLIIGKLLRQLKTLDHTFLCELLMGKLQDRSWQVCGKSLVVIETLIVKSSEDNTFSNYFAQPGPVKKIQDLCTHAKQPISTRATKVRYSCIPAGGLQDR